MMISFTFPPPNCLLLVLAKQHLNSPACNHQQETQNPPGFPLDNLEIAKTIGSW